MSASLPHPRQLSALVYAGGSGRRLGGVIKANLLLGGVPLLRRVAAHLRPADKLLVTIGKHDASAFSALPEALFIADSPEGSGPLAGLRAGVTWLLAHGAPPEALLVTASVDAPLLPPDYLQRMTDHLGPASAAVAVAGGQRHPTHALYRLAAAAEALSTVSTGAGPRLLLDVLKAVEIPFDTQEGDEPFLSINTPADLETIASRLPAGRNSPTGDLRQKTVLAKEIKPATRTLP